MSLNNITFNLGQGGLGRPLAGEDYISGLLFYSATLPSGYSSSDRIKQFFSVADAEAKGIVGDYRDETQATGSLLVTAAGAAGDSVEIRVDEPLGKTIVIGSYTRSSTDSTVNLVATGIAAAINAGTATHGYSATVSTATVTIKARKGLGIFLNSGTPITYGIVGTVAFTVTQFTGGVASVFKTMHYHISEYFRIQPKGNLFVGIYAVPSTYTFSEIATIQNFANGKIRQIGVFKNGAALGASISYATGKSVTTLGATLGAVAKAKVSQSIAWVAQFNISNGVECDVLAFANGVAFSNSSVTDGLLTSLQDKRYIFLRKSVGVARSYFNENSSSIAVSSDYAYIADNRTIQKATRGIYTNLAPALNSPIVLNADGTISDEAIAYFTGLAEEPLIQMIRDAELSGEQVVINSTQNILSTGILVISVNLVQVATGRNIQVNIGYSVSV
jgi:hypothetical protein